MIDPADLRDVFDRAASLPPQQRADFLARACGDNDRLRREVERLLAADARLGSAFDTEPGSDLATGSDAAGGTSLQPGTRLGPYEIVAALGAGGMGEVYKARDTRLDRTVVIKVLAHDLIADPAARQRFDREARAVAALSHPHICPLFDIGHQDGIDFLVMEFLDGETLAARLRRGKLPLDDALACATHVADAVAAAHRAGIVHRDLKPANIMLTASGVKLLDFGLAKRRQPPIASDITKLTAEPLTHTGMILGTVQYMAPEQLEGQPVDERTDIFAFGVVLYEMLTGRPAFEGASSAAVIGNILHAEPPKPSSIERLTPASLDELVRGCLAKDPAKRCQAVADVQSRLIAARDQLTPMRQRASKSWIVASLTSIFLVLVVAAVARWRWPQSPAAIPQRDSPLVQRSLTRLTFDDGLQTDPSFSPDGRFIAFASDRNGNFDIWVKQLSGGEAVQVTKSPAEDSEPSWSPDGNMIAFRSERDGGGIYLVPALGGLERRLTSDGVHPTWSPDGKEVRFQTETYVFGQTSGLYAAPTDGGPVHQLLPEFTATGQWRWIETHPDGRVSFLGFHRQRGLGCYTVSANGAVSDADVFKHAPPSLTDMRHSGGQRFHWSADGRSVLLETEANNGVQNLWRIRVDPTTLQWLSYERLTTSSGSDVSAQFSRDASRVVFSTQNAFERLWQFGFDPVRRRASKGQPLTEESGIAIGSDISSDERIAAYHLAHGGVDPPQISLWLMPLKTRKAQLLAVNAFVPSWSSDHRWIAYLRFRTESGDPKSPLQPGALAVRKAGGSERLISPWTTDAWPEPGGWETDGRAVLVSAGARVMIWPVRDPPATAPSRIVLEVHEADLHHARLSPNKRWLAVSIRLRERPGTMQIGLTTFGGPPNRAVELHHERLSVGRAAPLVSRRPDAVLLLSRIG